MPILAHIYTGDRLSDKDQGMGLDRGAVVSWYRRNRARSRALFEAWRGAKTWHEVPSSDHDSIAGEPGYWRSIADFLKALRGGTKTPLL